MKYTNPARFSTKAPPGPIVRRHWLGDTDLSDPTRPDGADELYKRTLDYAIDQHHRDPCDETALLRDVMLDAVQRIPS